MERTLQDLKSYCERTKIPKKTQFNYSMCCSELHALYALQRIDAYKAICLAFDYGRAKGYRAAKAAKK